MQEENERFENELMARFTDPVQISTLMIKWIQATTALGAAQDQPAYASARANWAAGCRVMGKLKCNFEAVRHMLDGLTATLVQPETVVAERKRKKAAAAATIRGHRRLDLGAQLASQ